MKINITFGDYFMIYIPFILLAILLAFWVVKYQWKLPYVILIVHPFIAYYIFNSLYLELVNHGPGVPFYWFGYVTLSTPMAAFSIVIYALLKRFSKIQVNRQGDS